MRLVLLLTAALLASCGGPGDSDRNAAGNVPAGAPAEPAANATAQSIAANAAAASDPAIPPLPPADVNVIPAPFQGRYDESVAACGRPSDGRLEVTGRELRFHESIGQVRTVSAEGARAVKVTADYQGEGESWQSVRTLRLSADGGSLTISGDGSELVKVRCP